ncbi:MAG: CotH kinase family protein [Chitinispirillia bacterium]|nr:CotH kinase family protein [Chitinispirillia bacterium]
MTFKLTDPDNPQYNITVDTADTAGMRDRIRGRGNNSWRDWRAQNKRPYRINFKNETSLLGLTPARNWVLLAQHRDETLLYNAVAFELGNRFAFRFNHTFNFVDLYMNGEYKGNYLLSETNQAGPGRVDIDKEEGWFAELDQYYDSEPKFRTENYDLPVMIKWPKRDKLTSEENPVHAVIKSDFKALTDALASPNFPESGYRELINITTFIDFLMINELAANTDLSHPRSTFLYKDKGGVISMGPLWDFDSGYGWSYRNWQESGFNDHFNHPERRSRVHDFFKRFYDDPVFLVKHKERWNEKYDTIASVPLFIDEMEKKLAVSAQRNFDTFWYKINPPFTDTRPPNPNVYGDAVNRLKNWYSARVYYLNAEFNRVDVRPQKVSYKMLSDDSDDDNRLQISPQALTLISYGEMSELSARLQTGDSSSFQIDTNWNQTEAGNGGYLAVINVNLKTTGFEASDTLILSGINQGKPFSLTVPLDFTPPPKEKIPLIQNTPKMTFQKRGAGSRIIFWRR